MASLKRDHVGPVIDEKLLLAAASLPKEGFTAEDLVVSAFQHFPADFSLMGFPQYPDSNKVLTQITTSGRGLQRRGWLIQIGTKRYQLTGEALRHLERLGAASQEVSLAPDNRDVVDMIIHWLGSQALDRYRVGHSNEIQERQALAYWKLSSGATAARTHRMLAIAESAAAALDEGVRQQKEVKLRHDLRVSPQDAQALLNLHRVLADRFRDALLFLRSQRR